jgi:hypothetical protein
MWLLILQLGVTITPKDDSQFSIFAPNAKSMVEAKEMINEILEKTVGRLNINSAKNSSSFEFIVFIYLK